MLPIFFFRDHVIAVFVVNSPEQRDVRHVWRAITITEKIASDFQQMFARIGRVFLMREGPDSEAELSIHVGHIL